MQALKGGLTAAVRLQDAQKSRQRLQQVIALGSKYHIIVPIDLGTDGMADDIRAVSRPGFTCDFEKLRVGFVKTDNYQINDSGVVEDLTVLSTWTKIANVIYRAEEAAEKAKCQRDVEAEAEATGKSMQDMSIALATKLRDIELAYEGNKDNKIYPTKARLIKGVEIKIAMEMIVVPIIMVNSVEMPDWNNASIVTYEPSQSKTHTLLNLMHDPSFRPAGQDYLEIIYDYGKGCTDKQQAGRQSTFQGCSSDMSLAQIDPDGWKANKDKLFDRLSKDAETIEAKNFTLSHSKSVREVSEILKDYVSKQTLMLTKIDLEAESTAKVAKDMVDMGLLKGVPKVQDQLIALAEKTKGDKPEANNASAEIEAISAVSNVQSLTELVNVADSTGIEISSDAEELSGDVDLTSL